MLANLLPLALLLALAVGSGQSPAKDSSAGKDDRTETWSGALADAGCISGSRSPSCEVVSHDTPGFAVVTGSGEVWTFTAPGNEAVRSELQRTGKSGRLMIWIRGRAEGDRIEQVDSLIVA